MIVNSVLIILGFILLIKCSDLMINSASTIAEELKVPAFIIGFSIIAFGTSSPELIIGIFSGITKTNNITLGTVLGSAVANVALVAGIAAIMSTIHIGKTILMKEIPLSILVQVLLLILLFLGGSLSRIDGAILLICFVAFLWYIFTRKKDTLYVDDDDISDYETTKRNNDSILKLSFILLGSLFGVTLGGALVVYSATEIARIFGVSEFVIGVTIVAIGTSLPELVTTITAIKKQKSDIAIGNIIGSNIFNILLVLGVSSTINPIVPDKGIIYDFIIVFGATILLVVLSIRKKQLKKLGGIILIGYYVFYIIYNIFNSKA